MLYLSLAILILALGASVFGGRSFGKILFFKYVFIFSIVLVFILVFYQSCRQFQIWSRNEFSQFLLPPHQNINYFIFYSASRFFAPYFVSLIAAALFLFSARIINKKYEERFFHPEEPYLGALAIFLAGHPGWLFYVVFLIFIYLLIHLYSSFIVHSSSGRLSLYYLWIPIGIFVIIIFKWLQILPIWKIFEL